MNWKVVSVGALGAIFVLFLCTGVVYFHESTAGEFADRANATGLNMVNGLSDTFEIAKGFITGVGNYLRWIWGDTIKFFTGHFSEMQTWKLVGAFFEQLWAGLIKIWENMTQAAAGGWNSFWQWVASVFNPVTI